MRPANSSEASLCRRPHVSCVRCCLPHLGGDSHLADPEIEQPARLIASRAAGRRTTSDRYLGPHKLLMKFTNFNPLQDPRIEASQYEDCFPDVGKAEMERRFADRLRLFLGTYDPEQPRLSLPRYMQTAQESEGYRYKPAADSGIASLYIGGSVPAKISQRGELPECQLLGYVDADKTVGCMAHPLAETSRGYDGRDQVGFFHHSGCCRNVGCEASYEFGYLSASAMKVFDRAVEGMSWYDYSRHSTSVLVYFLRGYDHLLQRLDELGILDRLPLRQLVAFTNSLYEEWPLKGPASIDRQTLSRDSAPMNSHDILSMDIPLAERILHIALGTRFQRDHFARQLQQARSHIGSRVEALKSGTSHDS